MLPQGRSRQILAFAAVRAHATRTPDKGIFGQASTCGSPEGTGAGRVHLDGWSLRDLRSLPLWLLRWLAMLQMEVEAQGQWLEALALGYMAIIPKPREECPPHTKTLSFLALV